MEFSPKPDAALLIVGHGLTENPDSSTPYFDHAKEIRDRNVFGEVHCCFWKEEPSIREAVYMIDADEIYVVPDFISEGYFTQEVIPREFGLTGPTTVVDNKTFHCCDPVGIHPSMTSLISSAQMKWLLVFRRKNLHSLSWGMALDLIKIRLKRLRIKSTTLKLCLTAASLMSLTPTWKSHHLSLTGAN